MSNRRNVLQNSSFFVQYAQILESEQRSKHQKFRSITIEYTPHETFKQEGKSAKATVRSGECTPYANIILYAGVTF